METDAGSLAGTMKTAFRPSGAVISRRTIGGEFRAARSWTTQMITPTQSGTVIRKINGIPRARD
jgi:hypothetical protein